MKALSVRTDEEEDGPGSDLANQSRSVNPLPLISAAGILLAALLPRLLYLFFVSDPQNAGDGMTDTYNHWQIGYLTSQIGLSHGLRLWDLKGMEYFWGLLHPLILVVVFLISGSIDIVVPRLLSLTCGSLSVLLIFQLCRRYWGLRTAVASAAFAALSPISIFNDTQGMGEPLAIMLILAGLWWWPAKGLRAGIFWGLSTMARAEAWAFTLGLILAMFLRRSRGDARLPMILGWVAIMAVYTKILLDRTGNPIYPVYWEFAVEVMGRWLDPTLTSHQHAMQALFVLLALTAGAGLTVSLWKRPNSYMLLTYGFGSSAFVASLLAFTPFLSSWSGWVWRSRLLTFPADFAVILLAVLLFVLLPRRLGRQSIPALWCAAILLPAGAQLDWRPIHSAYSATEPTWQTTMKVGRTLSVLHAEPSRREGAINIPADHPSLTYALARFGGVRAEQIVGQLYDPFYDLPSTYRYADHPATASVLLQCWLRGTRSSIFVVPQTRQDYGRVVTDHPAWFTSLDTIPEYDWSVQAANLPTPSSQ